MAKPAPPKLEPIRAADLHQLSEEARRLFVQRTASTQPGFSYELSLTLPIWNVFHEAYERGYSRNRRCAFDNALASSNLSLARAWGAKKKKAPVADSFNRNAWPSVKWLDSMRIVHESSATDDQAWRARAWILSATSNKAIGQLQADELACEAVSAFCSGRPALGLMICESLAKHSAHDLAHATASIHEWPERIAPEIWAKGGQSAYEFRKAAEPNRKGNSFAEDPADIALSRVPLLSHVDFWSRATRATQPELARKLSDAHDALWQAGAFASPKNHARLFAQAPYGHSDPRAMVCEAASLDFAAQTPSYYWERPGAAKLIYSEILSQCCAYPGHSDQTAEAWDGFLSAHPKSPHAQPDPFAVVGGISCALLSLRGDGKLIQIGLDRGHSPAPSAWILAKPGSMAAAFARKALPSPAVQLSPATQAQGIFPEGFAIHAPQPKRGKRRPAQPSALAAPEGLPKTVQAKEDASSWLYQSLASIALACGKTPIARALSQAGCPSGDFVQVLSETAADKKHEVAELAAAVEAEMLYDASVGATEKPSTKRTILRV